MAVDLFSIGPVTIHGYGLMIGIGFVMAMLMGYYRFKKKGLDPEAVFDILLICAVFGFGGGKLFYIFVEWRRFLEDPLAVLGSEGFVVYGGIIVSVLVIMAYCHHKKFAFLDYFDALVPEVALAQGFGRIGCFLAGCCYGRPTQAWFGVTFPDNSLGPGSGVKVIPTELISSAGDFLICLALILIDAKTRQDPKRRRGDIGFLYMDFYAIGRFLVEILRGDPRGNIGVLSTSQFISIFMLAAGILLMIREHKRQPEGSFQAAFARRKDCDENDRTEDKDKEEE